MGETDGAYSDDGCLLSALASAATAAPAGVYLGAKLDFGQWLDSRKKGTSGSLEEYVLGFMDGFTLGRGVEFWSANGAKISRESVFQWMDTYCLAHPLDQVITGGVALYEERTGWKP
jgi:hypothetical protein